MTPRVNDLRLCWNIFRAVFHKEVPAELRGRRVHTGKEHSFVVLNVVLFELFAIVISSDWRTQTIWSELAAQRNALLPRSRGEPPAKGNATSADLTRSDARRPGVCPPRSPRVWRSGAEPARKSRCCTSRPVHGSGPATLAVLFAPSVLRWGRRVSSIRCSPGSEVRRLRPVLFDLLSLRGRGSSWRSTPARWLPGTTTRGATRGPGVHYRSLFSCVYLLVDGVVPRKDEVLQSIAFFADSL